MAEKEQRSTVIKFFNEDINDTSTVKNGWWDTVKRAFVFAYRAEQSVKLYQLVNPLNFIEALVLLPAELLDRISLIGLKENSSIGTGRKLVRTMLNTARIPHLLIRPITYPSKYLLPNGTKEEFTRSDMLIAASVILIAALTAGVIAAILFTGGFGIPALAAFVGAAGSLGAGIAGLTGLSAAASVIIANAVLIGSTFIVLAKVVPAMMEELQGIFNYLFVRNEVVATNQVALPAEPPRESHEDDPIPDEETRRKAEEERKNLEEESRRKEQEEEVKRLERERLAEAEAAEKERKHLEEKQLKAADRSEEVAVQPAKGTAAATVAAKKPGFEYVYEEFVSTEITFCQNMGKLAAILKRNKDEIINSIESDLNNKHLIEFASLLIGKIKHKPNNLVKNGNLLGKELFAFMIDVYEHLSSTILVDNLDKNDSFEKRTADLLVATDTEGYSERILQLTLATLFYLQMQNFIQSAREQKKLKTASSEDDHALANHPIAPLQRVTKLVLLAKELLKQYQESENPDLQSITKLKWLLYRFKIITNCINQLKKLQETVPDDLTVSLISHAVKATSKVSEASAKENFEKELAELAKNITLDQEEDMLKTASEHIPPDDLISSINGLSKEITTEIMSRSGIFHAPITQSPVAEPMLSTAVPSESDMPQASMAASLGNSMSSLGGPFHRSSQQPLQLHKEQDNLPQIKNDGKPATLADAAIFDPMQLSAAAAPAETSSNSTNQKSSLTSDELANTKFKNKE